MPDRKQQLIRQIRQLKRDGEPLNHAAVNKSHNTLLAHATEQFGSWQAAIEAAGLDYRQISKLHRWSKEEVLEELRRLRTSGEIADVSTLARDYPKLFAACRRFFGTGRLALAAAGFSYDQILEEHPRRWTKAKCIRHLQLRDEAGKSLSRAIIMRNEPSEKNFCYAVINHFGTWGAALKAAKINPQEVRNRERLWPKARVLAEIHQRHQSGKLLYTDFMLRDALPLHAAGKRHFGSWQKAIEQAGINYRRNVLGGLRGFSRERTKRTLRARLANDNCSERHVRDDSPAVYRAIIHYFGDWESALRAVGSQS